MSTTCPECGTLGRAVTRTDSGRAVFTCPQCPETLVKKGHEVGFTLSGPRWLGPRPAPAIGGSGMLGITAGISLLSFGRRYGR